VWPVLVAGNSGSDRRWFAVLVMGHLLLTRDRAREATLVLTVGLFGFAVDTLQASAGLYAFTGTSVLPWVCPPWMVALWMLFATTLNSSMAWLAGRRRLAAVLGAVCGPLSYAAGARLGAIELHRSALVSPVSRSVPSGIGSAAAWCGVISLRFLTFADNGYRSCWDETQDK
jgi:hypothetical protein